MKHLAFLFFCLSLPVYLWAQEYLPVVQFVPNANQNLGFNFVPQNEWKEKFPTNSGETDKKQFLPVKILAQGKTDWVSIILPDSLNVKWTDLDFFYGNQALSLQIISKGSAQLKIENPQLSDEIGAYYQNQCVSRLRTFLCASKTRKVVIVPLMDLPKKQRIEAQIKKVFLQANIEISILTQPTFSSKVFNSSTVFGQAERTFPRFTGQMRLLRDQYFKTHPSADKNAHYLFVLPQFTDENTLAYALPYKTIAFVPFQQNAQKLGNQLARALATEMGGLKDSWQDGPAIGSTKNLMDTTHGTQLLFFQISELQNRSFFFNPRDEYEFVKAGNGTVAYYFWEEDDKGNILWNGFSPLPSLQRPYKKNYLAYRFDVQFFLLQPLFRWGIYYISILNFLFLGIVLFLLFYLRLKVKQYWETKKWKRFLRRWFFWLKLSASVVLLYWSLSWGNALLDAFKMIEGPLPELGNLSYPKASKELFANASFRKQSEFEISSEILTHTRQKWQFKKTKNVLYFEILEQADRKKSILRFTTSSDSLIVRMEKYKALADNHYLVFTKKNTRGDIIQQDVYNYNQQKLAGFSHLPDPPKRILVFVNGYRPTSTDANLESSFAKVLKQGLEYPNSTNHIYNFDRYGYWEPWGQINLQFQNKINPSVVLYADGHFSVSTSNYRSVLQFTRISQMYPKRCPNPKKHVCHTVKNTQFLKFLQPKKKTKNLIDLWSNSAGFNYRKKKGEIAGRNLLQEINSLPGRSKNDTLFLVSHSMGHAYSLGMISVLRGKIILGGLYILAPENAKSGKVFPKEWKEIWQYGSRFNLTHADPPCLQDGVAPQSAVGGLPYRNRAFIPADRYLKKGFFDSHFVGYYDWIMTLQPNQPGYLMQR